MHQAKRQKKKKKKKRASSSNHCMRQSSDTSDGGGMWLGYDLRLQKWRLRSSSRTVIYFRASLSFSLFLSLSLSLSPFSPSWPPRTKETCKRLVISSRPLFHYRPIQSAQSKIPEIDLEVVKKWPTVPTRRRTCNQQTYGRWETLRYQLRSRHGRVCTTANVFGILGDPKSLNRIKLLLSALVLSSSAVQFPDAIQLTRKSFSNRFSVSICLALGNQVVWWEQNLGWEAFLGQIGLQERV